MQKTSRNNLSQELHLRITNNLKKDLKILSDQRNVKVATLARNMLEESLKLSRTVSQ
jgi:hypothetical protein